DEDGLVALENLERVRHVRRARDAREIAFDLRVAREPVRLVLLLLVQCPRLVRNLLAVDDAETSPHGPDRPQGEDLPGWDRTVPPGSEGERGPSHVSLNIEVRGVE